MKKILNLMLVALMATALVACHGNDPKDPTENAFCKIEVANVTGTSADITITPKDTLAPYYVLILPEEYYADYKTLDSLNAYFNEEAEYWAMLYEYFGMEFDIEELLYRGVIEAPIDELEGETTYYIIAVAYDEALQALAGDIVVKDFTTLVDEGGNEGGNGGNEGGDDDPYYSFEPTTASTVNLTFPADSAEALNYADYYEVGTNFSVFLWDAQDMISLDFIAPAGAAQLPAGTYTVATEAYAENTLAPGNYYLYSNNYGGSYAVIGGAEAYWIVGGSIKVALNGNTYNISGALKSYYGSTINVSYTGAIPHKTGEVTTAAPKRVKAMATAPSLIKKNKFARFAK